MKTLWLSLSMLAAGAAHAAPDAAAAYTAQLRTLEGAAWTDAVLGEQEVAASFAVEQGRFVLRFGPKEPAVVLEPIVERPDARYEIADAVAKRLCRAECTAFAALMGGGSAVTLTLLRPGKEREARLFRRTR